MSGPYTLLVLDADSCELSNTEHDTKRDAIDMARARTAAGTEYRDWRTVEIRDARGECVWDKRRHYCRCCGEPTETGEDCCSDNFPEAGDLREWA